MPFIADGRKLIRHAYENGYALPSFNICSLEMAQGCIDAARELQAPIILQTYQADLTFGSPRVMAAMVKALAEEANVMLHLDHGLQPSVALECLEAGYSSVMLDGAALDFEQLVQSTKKLAAITTRFNASLEVSSEPFNHGQSKLTDPHQARRLFEAGADMIACSVGSEHGQYSRLDLRRLELIAKTVQAPLVLHGGSGIQEADLQAAISLGVVKVNIGSALYRALLGVWNKTNHSHRVVYTEARAEVCTIAKHFIRLLTLGDTYEFAQSD